MSIYNDFSHTKLQPAYISYPASYAVLADQLAANQRFATWYKHNTTNHKVSGYRTVSAPLLAGGITARQLARLAKLADRYSFGAIRFEYDQRLVLADVAQQNLYPLWRGLSKLGLVIEA